MNVSVLNVLVFYLDIVCCNVAETLQVRVTTVM